MGRRYQMAEPAARLTRRRGRPDRAGTDGAEERQPTLLTVERALRLLKAIVFEQGLSIRQAGRVTGTSPSSAYRLLRALDEAGFIEREVDGGRFRPGPELRRMVAHVLGTTDVRRMAIEPMQRLAARWRETVTLVLRTSDDRRLNFDRVASPRPLQYVMPLGDTGPLHVGSSGRAILAFMQPEEIERALAGPLESYTSATPTDPAVVREELARTRERGYAASFGERLDREMVGISAPIFDARGTVIGALLLSAPTGRMSEIGSLDLVGASVREAADQVSLGLGWLSASGEARRDG
jgi:IclR family transcriptional regulator, acetate operon repressor